MSLRHACTAQRPGVDGEVSALSSIPEPGDDGVVIVGAGAAGLATAIFTRQLNPTRPVVLLDGAPRPGAKILVSGGSRCNVTNSIVSEQDFWGGKRTIIRRVLRALTVEETISFFTGIGVPLEEEPGGKLFPRSNRSRDVLDALLRTASDAGVRMLAGTRVHEVSAGRSFTLTTSRGRFTARAVVLATGGLSLPKTGSDGGGLLIARSLGHSIVPTTPALVPLLLTGSFNERISGVAHPAELTIRIDERIAARLNGPLLWTHFGISGPVALDASRHILRGRIEGRSVRVALSFIPGESFESVEARLKMQAARRPKTALRNALGPGLPISVTDALLDHLGLDGGGPLSDLSREARRSAAHALTALPLDVPESRGYNYAEVTAGGVALDEIDSSAMASRKCGSLFLVGEMLDVDGRLGGFNFQWAWSSGRAAAQGITRLLS